MAKATSDTDTTIEGLLQQRAIVAVHGVEPFPRVGIQGLGASHPLALIGRADIEEKAAVRLVDPEDVVHALRELAQMLVLLCHRLRGQPPRIFRLADTKQGLNACRPLVVAHVLPSAYERGSAQRRPGELGHQPFLFAGRVERAVTYARGRRLTARGVIGVAVVWTFRQGRVHGALLQARNVATGADR